MRDEEETRKLCEPVTPGAKVSRYVEPAKVGECASITAVRCAPCPELYSSNVVRGVRINTFPTSVVSPKAAEMGCRFIWEGCLRVTALHRIAVNSRSYCPASTLAANKARCVSIKSARRRNSCSCTPGKSVAIGSKSSKEDGVIIGMPAWLRGVVAGDGGAFQPLGSGNSALDSVEAEGEASCPDVDAMAFLHNSQRHGLDSTGGDQTTTYSRTLAIDARC